MRVTSRSVLQQEPSELCLKLWEVDRHILTRGSTFSDQYWCSYLTQCRRLAGNSMDLVAIPLHSSLRRGRVRTWTTPHYLTNTVILSAPEIFWPSLQFRKAVHFFSDTFPQNNSFLPFPSYLLCSIWELDVPNRLEGERKVVIFGLLMLGQ